MELFVSKAEPSHSHHMRRRLPEANASSGSGMPMRPGANAGSQGPMVAESDSSDMGYETQPPMDPTLIELRLSAQLSITLYSMLALVIVYMTVQHFRFESSLRKRVFHVILLLSIVMQFPPAVELLSNPGAMTWKAMYFLRVFPMLLQSICKSFLSICWSEVVSAGQSFERRKITTVVMVFNGLLLLWGVTLIVVLSQYKDDPQGWVFFHDSIFRVICTYGGIGVIFGYGLLLLYQGMRLRRRLLLAKGSVPADSVDKSLSQLMLTVVVIVFSDILRITGQLMSEYQVRVSVLTLAVINNLIPFIFPTICMLYLMRRYNRHTDVPMNLNEVPTSANMVRRMNNATLASFMTESQSSQTPHADLYMCR